MLSPISTEQNLSCIWWMPSEITSQGALHLPFFLFFFSVWIKNLIQMWVGILPNIMFVQHPTQDTDQNADQCFMLKIIHSSIYGSRLLFEIILSYMPSSKIVTESLNIQVFLAAGRGQVII